MCCKPSLERLSLYLLVDLEVQWVGSQERKVTCRPVFLGALARNTQEWTKTASIVFASVFGDSVPAGCPAGACAQGVKANTLELSMER